MHCLKYALEANKTNNLLRVANSPCKLVREKLKKAFGLNNHLQCCKDIKSRN